MTSQGISGQNAIVGNAGGYAEENERTESEGVECKVAESAIRYHYMDNVRALAMMLGIFFHAALAYSPLLREIWISSDQVHSYGLDFFVWFSHLFRMPVFFIIAGFFSYYFIVRKGSLSFIKNRALRIVLPFVLFLFACKLAVFFSLLNTAQDAAYQSKMLKMVLSFVTGMKEDTTPFSTMHLWFLLYLVFFYVIALFFTRVRPFSISRLSERLFKSPALFLLACPLIVMPGFLMTSTPHPPSDKLYPELWAMMLFGSFYLFGWLLFAKQGFIDEIRRYWWGMLLVVLVFYPVFYSLLPDVITLESFILLKSGAVSFYSYEHTLMAILSAYVSVYMSLLVLIAGKQFLNKKNAWLRYIADSSYWVYLIHIPVLFQIQLMLMSAESMGPELKFLIASFTTIAIGMISYVLFVRKTPIGWMLNGKR